MSHNVVSCIQTVVVCVVGVRGRGLPEQGCLTVVFLVVKAHFSRGGIVYHGRENVKELRGGGG